MTLLDAILYPALRNAGVTGGPARTPSPDQIRDAFRSLNRLISSWSISRGNIFSEQAARYTLSPSQTSYTIGEGGADFEAPRPIRITRANIVLTGSSPEVRVPLEILTTSQWANIRVQQIPTTLPVSLYNDGNYPNARLYLWGYPTQANDLELYTWQAIDQFVEWDPITEAADVEVELPPGYEDALVYNLAVRLAAQFGLQAKPEVYEFARQSKAAIRSLNSKAPKIGTADLGTPRPYFNYRSGM